MPLRPCKLAHMTPRWATVRATKAKKRHASFSDLAERPAFESRMPARFDTLEAFEAFIEATQSWAGMQPSFRVYYPSGHDIVAALSVRDLFRISAGRLEFLSIFTPVGEMRFDYRNGPLIEVYAAVGREPAVSEWVSILQRHLRPVPWLRRWKRYSIASNA